MDLAISFLLAHQDPDGHWHDFLTLAGEATNWTTGYIAAQLKMAGVPQDCLNRAARALLADRQEDWGWGYHRDVPTDSDSSAYALLFLVEHVPDISILQKSAHCLLTHQDPISGGFATYREPTPIRRFMGLSSSFTIRGWCQPHLEVTAAAGRALAMLDGPWQNAAEQAWQFVQDRQQPDGCWLSYWWALPLYPTWQAVALACKLPFAPKAKQAVERAVKWVLQTQSAEGGWAPLPGKSPSAFATALAISILAYTGEQGSSVERGIASLRRMQRPDGAWDSDPILCIPPPEITEPSHYTEWRVGELGTGVVIRDQHRLYTTATCLAALVLAKKAHHD